MSNYIGIDIGGKLEYRHKQTGNPLHMVSETETLSGVDDYGVPFSYRYTHKRPAKWYKTENIKVIHIKPARRYIRLYG